MRTLVVTMLSLVASLPLFATPSTLVFIPSTDIKDKGVLHLDTDVLFATEGDEGDSIAGVGLLYGLTDRIEVGFDVFTDMDKPVFLNAKVMILDSETAPIALSAGIFNFNASVDDQQVYYALASKEFGPVRLTAGGFTSDEDTYGEDNSGILAGIEYATGPWWLAADSVSGESSFGSWHVGIGRSISDNTGIIIGYDNFESGSEYFNIQYDVDFEL